MVLHIYRSRHQDKEKEEDFLKGDGQEYYQYICIIHMSLGRWFFIFYLFVSFVPSYKIICKFLKHFDTTNLSSYLQCFFCTYARLPSFSQNHQAFMLTDIHMYNSYLMMAYIYKKIYSGIIRNLRFCINRFAHDFITHMRAQQNIYFYIVCAMSFLFFLNKYSSYFVRSVLLCEYKGFLKRIFINDVNH